MADTFCLVLVPNTQTVTVQQKLEELRVLAGKYSSPQEGEFWNGLISR